MGTPQFIRDLRSKIGHSELWLMGANAIVLRDGAVLLVRRSDNGRWTAISGIVDPGEHPAETAVRESLEETGVLVEVERLAWVIVTDSMAYPNGDRCRFLDHGFVMRWVSGEPLVGDEESTEVGWFPINDLPTPHEPLLPAMVEVATGPASGVRFQLD